MQGSPLEYSKRSTSLKPAISAKESFDNGELLGNKMGVAKPTKAAIEDSIEGNSNLKKTNQRAETREYQSISNDGTET